MTTPLDLMVNFRNLAGMPTPDHPRTEDLFIPVERHADFIDEEARELREDWKHAGSDAMKVIAAADALCDISVFLNHAICDLGLRHLFPALLAEVDRSNRTKGEDGVFFDPKTRKLIKGTGYEPPDLRQFFDGSAKVRISYPSLMDCVDTGRQLVSFVRKTANDLGAEVTESGTLQAASVPISTVEMILRGGHYTTLAVLAAEGGGHHASTTSTVMVSMAVATLKDNWVVRPIYENPA